jgi:hypothetical protein
VEIKIPRKFGRYFALRRIPYRGPQVFVPRLPAPNLKGHQDLLEMDFASTSRLSFTKLVVDLKNLASLQILSDGEFLNGDLENNRHHVIQNAALNSLGRRKLF